MKRWFVVIVLLIAGLATFGHFYYSHDLPASQVDRLRALHVAIEDFEEGDGTPSGRFWQDGTSGDLIAVELAAKTFTGGTDERMLWAKGVALMSHGKLVDAPQPPPARVRFVYRWNEGDMVVHSGMMFDRAIDGASMIWNVVSGRPDDDGEESLARVRELLDRIERDYLETD